MKSMLLMEKQILKQQNYKKL